MSKIRFANFGNDRDEKTLTRIESEISTFLSHPHLNISLKKKNTSDNGYRFGIFRRNTETVLALNVFYTIIDDALIEHVFVKKTNKPTTVPQSSSDFNKRKKEK